MHPWNGMPAALPSIARGKTRSVSLGTVRVLRSTLPKMAFTHRKKVFIS